MPGMDGSGPFGNGRFGRGLGPCGGGRPRRGSGFGWRVLDERDVNVQESLQIRKSWLEDQLADINTRLQSIKGKEDKTDQ